MFSRAYWYQVTTFQFSKQRIIGFSQNTTISISKLT